MDKPVIEVQHLSVTFNGRTVLSDLNFTLREGEIAALLGPNGSGKTTLIRTVLGLVPYRGRVLIYGRPVQDALRNIGYVPQKFEFDRTVPITVGEFLRMPFPRISRRKILRVLHEVDLKDYEDRPMGPLSGGQMQRVLMARSLVNDPSLLLLDEATSEVDTAGAKSFYEIISHLRTVHRTTVVLVSHEIQMVYKFADQIVCLNRDLICFGRPKEAITKEVLEKLYGKEVHFKEHQH
ncbi:MAG: hypothetical protein A3G87_06845 [Omnitrophica bacterium RIFCSPLOWO2_12_FULL_50_11]|nr:MAG: hypothetical protein A3G87_06845 [Omnitrophica bacterium RIFCSPLOWO2_12_FULL_50_11]